MKKKFVYIGMAFFLVLFFVKEISDGEITHFSFFNESPVSILNFGDVMFDRGVRNIIENRGRDPFEYIKKDLSFIKNFDVVIANLEGPIVVMDRSICQQKEFNFQFAPDTTDRLKSVGITMVNIANNHTYDCYSKGFESTKQYLKKAGIDYMGDSDVGITYSVKTIHNKKISFVGIDQTVSRIPVSDFYPVIKKMKSESDYVIVDIHWGTEYELTETPVQIAIGHALIDSGADVVFGHHPHVVEPVRVYKGKAIFYSLGNFVFDQNFGDTTTGLGAGVEFEDGKSTFNLFPFKLKLFAPDFLKGEDKDNFCETFLKDIKHKGCRFELTTTS